MISILKNQKALVLSAAVLLIFACNTQEKNKRKIIVEGTVSLPVNSKIYFFTYPDTLALYSEVKIPVDSVVIDADGKFSFEIPASHPLIFNIEDGKHELVTNLFACPGDQIEVNFSGKEFTPAFKIGTIAGKFNTYLTEFIDTFYREPGVKHEYYIATNYMDGHTFATYNNNRKMAQRTFFENYFKGIDLRKEYRNYALNAIEYGIAVDRLMYVWKKRMKSEPVVLDTDYFDFETPAFVENSTAFSSPSYFRFLNLYIKDIYERKVEKGELVATPGNRLDPAVEKYKLTIKLLKKPFSDAVLYNIIRGDLNNLYNTSITHSDYNTPVDSLVAVFKEKHSLR